MLFMGKDRGLGDMYSDFANLGVSSATDLATGNDAISNFLRPYQGSGSNLFADAYQQIRYGAIPSPGAGLTNPPNPAAPSGSQMTSYTPAQESKDTLSLVAGWPKQLGVDIASATASGAYTPNGPLSSTFDFQGLLVYGGIAAIALVLLNKVL